MSVAWDLRGPVVIDDVLGPDLCRQLLEEFERGDQQARSYQGVVDPTRRSCDFVAVSAHTNQVVSTLLKQPLDDAFGVATEEIADQPMVIYRYGPGVGFETHHDEVTDIELQRAEFNGQPVIGGDLTAVLFLNAPDDYEGGELYFEDPPAEDPQTEGAQRVSTLRESLAKGLRPAAGTLVTFPATKRFPHGVRPVLSGNRFTLLARRAVRDGSRG